MSGIYLIVWDEKERDQSKYLRPTIGGWPHLTLGYTGNILSREALNNIGSKCLSAKALHNIVLTKAVLNRFQDKPGHWRNDVLLHISDEHQDEVEALRDELLRKPFEKSGESENFYFGTPHVTHSVHDSQSDAEKQVEELNQILPYTVTITGVTID